MTRFVFVMTLAWLCSACTTTPASHDPQDDMGLLWVKHAAEYEALTRQVYQAAALALPGLVDDQSWSVVPGQRDCEGMRPAIIFDVDETVVSNVDFQLSFERPFDDWKLNAWSSSGPSAPLAGFAEFAAAARKAGVALFFVTNRPCEVLEGSDDPCPQEQTTIDDVIEAGIDTDAEHVMLAFERDDWTKEKVTRREHVAATHRVIMLFGDDLGDFIPCVRAKPSGPCDVPATAESRREAVARHAKYWGHGWYVLPNPMHGSWTTVK